MVKRKIIKLTSQFILATAMSTHLALAETNINYSVDISYINTNVSEPWLQSWQQQGTGITRYDDTTSAFGLRQGFFELTSEVSDNTNFNFTAYAHEDGEVHIGITEAFLTYKPLSPGWLKRYKFGAFYPVFSTENSAAGWQSPFTYSYSAINSWIGEELRVNGVEATFTRLGRRSRKNYDLSLVGAVYFANDPIGSLLTWRGWAIHDRQTKLNERVEMANYPSIDNENFTQPSWVEPFTEIDNRLGYYFGVHYKTKREHDIRLYWYDNLGNPTEIDSDHQYSWRTKFLSLAWKYQINASTHLLTQAMYGSTLMGTNDMVELDIGSMYVMLSKKTDIGRFSARVERFIVNEQDRFPSDPNDSDGSAITLAWRMPIFEHHEIGVEYLSVNSYNENRALWGWEQENRQNQLQLIFQLKM